MQPPQNTCLIAIVLKVPRTFHKLCPCTRQRSDLKEDIISVDWTRGTCITLKEAAFNHQIVEPETRDCSSVMCRAQEGACVSTASSSSIISNDWRHLQWDRKQNLTKRCDEAAWVSNDLNFEAVAPAMTAVTLWSLKIFVYSSAMVGFWLAPPPPLSAMADLINLICPLSTSWVFEIQTDGYTRKTVLPSVSAIVCPLLTSWPSNCHYGYETDRQVG